MKIRFIFILVVSCIFKTCFAQPISFSRVGSIGSFSDGGYVACLAVSFNTASECVKLNTGVSLFGATLGQREFIVSCKTNAANEPFDFALFPNPVVTYARLVARGNSSMFNRVNLSIVDASGRILWREKVDVNSLRTGLVLNIGHFSAGNYFLRLEVSAFVKVLPFVKVH